VRRRDRHCGNGARRQWLGVADDRTGSRLKHPGVRRSDGSANDNTTNVIRCGFAGSVVAAQFGRLYCRRAVLKSTNRDLAVERLLARAA
jgi:hypothetical protein